MGNKYYIMGRHCLEELFKTKAERILKVFTVTNRVEDPLIQKVKGKGIEVSIVPKNALFDLVKSESHQSIVALIKAKPQLEWKTFLEKMRSKEKSCLVLLDSIFDPHNLGAIFRAAECFGVDALIWSKNRGASISPVVTKSSSGATELVESVLVSNLAETIKRLKDIGYEAIVADVTENAESLFSFKFPKKSLLIMGSEGKGVQPLIKKNADHFVKVPMCGKIDSLNVSQATSIFLALHRRAQEISGSS